MIPNVEAAVSYSCAGGLAFRVSLSMWRRCQGVLAVTSSDGQANARLGSTVGGPFSPDLLLARVERYLAGGVFRRLDRRGCRFASLPPMKKHIMNLSGVDQPQS